MIYRAEIDGLRAVAVVPVILFHAGVAWFSGGFVGVDVFFVISGYLITTIILADLAVGRFSIARFYERRARRILPALSVVLLACLPFAWAWMLPQELVAFGKSLIATALFGANILFWRESGYFDAAAELKPLLHTWSLAVEEQYYLFFPPVLALIWRWRQALVMPALVLVSLLSLMAAQWGAHNAPSANFYLLPSRMWELLIGVMVALRHSQGRSAGPDGLSDLAGLTGLAMILYAVFAFDAATPMPSLWTLIPVAGTALVLGFARQGTQTAQLLALRPLVGLGLISYSAYLWHQPLLAFARIRNVAPPEGPLLWGLLAATFGLAWFSWRFVEQPFRGTAPWLPGGRRIGLATLASIGAVCLTGAALVAGEGFGARKAPSGSTFGDLGGFEAMFAPNYGLDPACDAGAFTLSPKCRTADDPALVLWGDSYAMHLVQALQSSPSAVPFAQLTLSQCAAFPGLAVNGSVTGWQDCLAFNDAALAWILEQDSVRTVVISSPFNQTISPLRDRTGAVIDTEEARRTAIADDLASLSDQLAAAGKRLVVVSFPPRTGPDLGMCFARNYLMGKSPESCDFPIDGHYTFSVDSINLLKKVQEKVPVLWLEDILCATGTCRVILDGVPVYRDAGHLSFMGSAKLGETADLAGMILSAAVPAKPAP